MWISLRAQYAVEQIGLQQLTNGNLTPYLDSKRFCWNLITDKSITNHSTKIDHIFLWTNKTALLDGDNDNENSEHRSDDFRTHMMIKITKIAMMMVMMMIMTRWQKSWGNNNDNHNDDDDDDSSSHYDDDNNDGNYDYNNDADHDDYDFHYYYYYYHISYIL